MEDIRTEQMLQMLQTASNRLKNASDETVAFNLLSALYIEHYETQTHSQIILLLLSSMCCPNGQNTFLHLFLQTIKIPHAYLDGQWNVYREKAFDGGRSRIDFFIESQSFCAIIEMKIDAGDGESQLARYASFGKKKRKKYCVYYLTLDSHAPEEQSASGLDKDKLTILFGFSEEKEDGCFPYLYLEEAKATFPSTYKRWINKLESLDDLPKIQRSPMARWFYAEDAQGHSLISRITVHKSNQ